MHKYSQSGAARAAAPGDVAARAGLALAGQVGHFLREHGETRPVPILGGVVVEAQLGGRVHVFWRLPGPPIFGALRRRRRLQYYARLLHSWGLATELRLDEPEPYVACWVARRRP